MFKILAAAFKG